MVATSRRATMRFALGLCLGLPAALAGCGRSRRPVGPEGNQEFRPFVFLHAGDPQIGGWYTIEETKERFVQLARVANELQPAFVVITGDLVDTGTDADQLRAFDEALAEFRVPVRVIPGNHDDLATYRRRHGEPYYAFAHNNCQFICLDSTRLSVGGSPEQWQWLEGALAAAREANRTHTFLVMHHPPPLPATAWPRLDALIRQFGVRVVLAGHVHRTQELNLGPCTVYTVAGTGWAADKRGFGYRVFRVQGPSPEDIHQQYVTLDTPVEQARAAIEGAAPSQPPR